MNTAKNDDMVQVKATLRVPGKADKPTIASMPRAMAERDGWEIVGAA